MTRRVAITGIGIVSSIGVGKNAVIQSLKNGASGIVAEPTYQELGFRSQVAGLIPINLDEALTRKERRFMGDGVAYNTLAMREAIQDSGLKEHEISHKKTGIIMGSGGPSMKNQLVMTDTVRDRGVRKVPPTMVPKIMSSTNSAVLATDFKIKGVNYSITSACSTSAHCIGNAMELIQWGKQDIVFAGGGEEIDWTLAVAFDAMGAMSSSYNDTPNRASRAFDRDRDGFVISGGGGVVVLENWDKAVARGAKIYGELVGYGATSDGHDMVAPSGEGAQRCMQQALNQAGNPTVDYINVHGTSTPVGDMKELEAIKHVFGDNIPAISSTKSLTGHALGAAGVNETIYTLLMMEHGFMAASANIESLDENAQSFPILQERMDKPFQYALSNSFGFGGTNASLIFKKHA